MEETLTTPKRHRSSPTGEERLIRVSNRLLEEAVQAAFAEGGKKVSERDVIAAALGEYVLTRKDALIEHAIQTVERYSSKQSS